MMVGPNIATQPNPTQPRQTQTQPNPPSSWLLKPNPTHHNDNLSQYLFTEMIHYSA